MTAARLAQLAALLVLGACSDGSSGGGWTRPRPPRLDTVDAATEVVDAAPAIAPRPGLVAPPGSLDAWFGALHRAETGAPDGRVLISMFGDSHTAGDALTGRMRVVLQGRFGDAGRGLVAAGHPPYRHYTQTDLGYGSTGTWRAVVGGRHADGEPFGVMGFRVEASRSAEAWVETCGSCASGTSVARFDLLYWRQPGGGQLEYRVDDSRWRRIATAVGKGKPPVADTLTVATTDGAHRLTVRRGKKKGVIALFGIALERDRPGVLIDGLGVVGRRLGHLDAWDWSVIGAQLARRDPRLVILQYGTNEADDPEVDLARLATQYDEVLARLRAVVPGASVLVLGPPDLGKRAAGKACDHLPPPAPQPPDAAPPDAAVAPECEWRTPPTLAAVIEVQRAAAARAGVAFYDTFAAMGGADLMEQLVEREPPLAYRDRVHFTAPGYQVWADALLGELLAAYDTWTASIAPVAPPAPAATPDAGTGSGG